MPRQAERTNDPFAAFVAMERGGWGDADVARAYADGFAKASAQHVPISFRPLAPVRGRRTLARAGAGGDGERNGELTRWDRAPGPRG